MQCTGEGPARGLIWIKLPVQPLGQSCCMEPISNPDPTRQTSAHRGAGFVPDAALLARLDAPGPRYTSYPTADRFTEAHDLDAHRHALAVRGIGGLTRPLSLYVHVPFCESICYYCACNKVVTRDKTKARRYLAALFREAELTRQAMSHTSPVTQLHLGGGTPTFLDDDQLQSLVDKLESLFPFSANAERSIEVDPRTVDAERLHALRRMGFNRISFGIQDFDRDVQAAVHRVQSEEAVFSLMAAARAEGFESINVDLIYGLPKQTPASFNRTLDTLARLAPDRVAVYAYAHLPERFKPQRRIHDYDLPNASARVAMLHSAITRLEEAGWDYIGMDHFARPDDALAIAKRQGRMHRNFQGYTTQPDCDLIALGVSAISRVGATYAQNVRTLDEYYDAIEGRRLPVFRGHAMSADDLLRHAVIMAIMCQGVLNFEVLDIAYLIDSRRHFADELAMMDSYVAQGLVEIDDEGLRVTEAGWFLVRAIARVFDRYAQRASAQVQFSRIL